MIGFYQNEDSSDAGQDESEEELQEDEDSYVNDERIVASICHTHGKLGASYYDFVTKELYILADVEDSKPEFALTRAFLHQIQPNNLIVSLKMDPHLVSILKNSSAKEQRHDNDEFKTEDEQEGNGAQVGREHQNIPFHSSHNQVIMNDQGNYYQIEDESLGQSSQEMEIDDSAFHQTSTTRKTKDIVWNYLTNLRLHFVTYYLFNLEKAKDEIFKIELEDIQSNLANEQQKQIYMKSVIDFSQEKSIRSVGALLRYLENKMLHFGEVEVDSFKMRIKQISYIQLDDYVEIDYGTLKALQVFNPVVGQFGSKIEYREYNALNALFKEFIHSSLGRKYLKKVLLSPSKDLRLLNERLNNIDYFFNGENISIRESLIIQIRRVKSVYNLFAQMKKCDVIWLKFYVWRNLFTTIRACVEIKRIIRTDYVLPLNRPQVPLPIFEKITALFSDELDNILDEMTRVINFELSTKNYSFWANQGVNEELDKKVEQYENLDAITTEYGKSDIEKYQHILPGVECTYTYHYGFILAVPIGSNEIIQNSDELKLVYILQDKVHYKTELMKQLDTYFGDLEIDIESIQASIQSDLRDFVLQYEVLINKAVECCIELDWCIAMAKVACEFNYSRPVLHEHDRIEIRKGRHPLAERDIDNFVPNDTYNVNKKVKILTGPNACGKSIYLKQVGIIVYLAQIGTFVPAEYASIGLVDKIFARNFATESVASGLSSFMTDLNHLANCVDRATARSLIILDEFGRGTQPVDGMSLLIATICYWLNNFPPHLFVSTHYDFLTKIMPMDKLHLYEFETLAVEKTIDGRVVYLFELVQGIADGLNIAADIALKAGVKESVIERAKHITRLLGTTEQLQGLKEIHERNPIQQTMIDLADKFLKTNINSKQDLDSVMDEIRSFTDSISERGSVSTPTNKRSFNLTIESRSYPTSNTPTNSKS